MSSYPLHVPEDLVDPDIFSTGEVQLIVPEQGAKQTKWKLVTRLSSIAFHALFFVFLLFQSKLFPPHAPTQAQIELAPTELVPLPPHGTFEPLKPSPPPVPPPTIHEAARRRAAGGGSGGVVGPMPRSGGALGGGGARGGGGS